jgi:hypothetical protein
MNFRFISHLETMAVMPILVKMMPDKWQPVEARGESNDPMIGLGASLALRGHDDITRENWLEDLPVHDTADLQPWRSMQRLLHRAKAAIMAEPIAQQYLSGEMARAMISRLDPGSTIFWHVDSGPYHQRTIRFHLPLVTNPGCLMYSGPQVQHMAVGSLWFFDNHVPHSAANWGQHQCLHLVFEMYRERDERSDNLGLE